MNCLHPELIEQYVQNKIQKDERHAIDDHLKICTRCRQAVDIRIYLHLTHFLLIPHGGFWYNRSAEPSSS